VNEPAISYIAAICQPMQWFDHELLLTLTLIAVLFPVLSVSLKECRYWDTRQQNPAHTQQLPERCYAMSVRHPLMVVATADRNIVVYNLANPQVKCCC
jgi:hypothetical protein